MTETQAVDPDDYDDTIPTPDHDGEPDQGDPNDPDVNDTPPARDHQPAEGAVDAEGRMLREDGSPVPPKAVE